MMRRSGSGPHVDMTLSDGEMTWERKAHIIDHRVLHWTSLINKGILIIPNFVGNITVEAYSGGKQILLFGVATPLAGMSLVRPSTSLNY